jgi:hypothetical protein
MESQPEEERGLIFYQGHVAKSKILAALFASALFVGLLQSSAAAEPCDRACLAGVITQYIDALVAHDPSKLPLAEKVRFTEDGKELKLGEGLWKTVTAKGLFRQDYLDTKKQVAATHVQVYEGTNQALYSALLYIQDRRITGIETLVQHITPDSRFQPKELGKPVKGMNDPVPAGKRPLRESMIKTALTYTEGLRIGNFTDAGTPFAAEAYRVENGVITAGEGCGRPDCGLYTQNITLHPGIIASVAAVDEENSVVLLWMNFGHTGTAYGEGNALVTFEAFKVWGGRIHSINAFFRPLPISSARFWPSSDPLPR